MKKRLIVLSLGGSLIIPYKIDFKFLEKFKKTVKPLYKKYKFIVVCGGGAIARTYIEGLKEEHRNEYQISQAGIRATRMNAMFMMQFFGKESNSILPKDMHEVKADIHKNDIIFCGALRYAPNSTSDSTAAKLAHFLKTEFINLTDVKGLYTSNPKIHKDAKLIPKIRWKEFEKMAHKTLFKAGQHFVLDQQASTLIRRHRIKTYILGKDVKQLENLLNEKTFIGTTIEG